jgi:hypothetical protein
MTDESRAFIRKNVAKQPVGQISVQPLAQKYFAFAVGQITDLTPRVSPERGAARDRHERCGGMRWTRNARKTNAHDAYGEVVWS